MGLVEAVVEWRPYILGYKTIVRTDHKSLKWLMTCQHPDGSRVANWALRIQEGLDRIVCIHLPVALRCQCKQHSEAGKFHGRGVDVAVGPRVWASAIKAKARFVCTIIFSLEYPQHVM